MIQIEYLPIVLTGLALSASIIYYTMTIRGNTLARKAQNFNQLWTYSDPNFLQSWRFVMELEWENYDDFITKHWQDYDTWTKISYVWQVLNPMGIHLMKGLLDVDMLYLYAGYEFLDMWERYKGIIEGLRETMQHPEFMSGFQYLADEMRKRRRERTPIDSSQMWKTTPHSR